MRIRTRFLAVLLVELLGFAALSGLSLATFSRVRALKSVVEKGLSLVSRSRGVYSLLKDVVFDLFTPASYQSLRSVVLSPRSLVTGRELAHETGMFREEYLAFMRDSSVSGLLRDPELGDAYRTAAPLAEKAFAKLEDLSVLMERLRSLYPGYDADLYQLIQESKDESLYTVFGEIRDSSFYLNNIVESFLNRFVRGIRAQADRLERSAVLALAAAVLFLGGVTVILVYGLSSSILASIGNLQAAMDKVAGGDFSVRVPARSRDELGRLAAAFERLAGDLKRNVESIPSILKDVNEALPDDPDLDRILAIIADALLREGGAQSVSVFMAAGASLEFVACSGFLPIPGWEPGTARPSSSLTGILPGQTDVRLVKDAAAESFDPAAHGLDPGLSSLLVVPLAVRRRTAGFCLFARRDRGFTDLEVSRLSASADYAAQVADNVAAYAALSARRDAEFLALQSQIRPHFIYNVLTSIMALNRMGDSARLEESVIALKEMLRYTLEHGIMATVAEEFAFLGKFCSLHKLRHQDRFDFAFTAQDAALDLRIPKLIVQPLVENALIHGLEPKRGPGRLSVAAAVSGSELRITVKDDGLGCDPASMEGPPGGVPADGGKEGRDDRSGEGRSRVGLGNVRRRLELIGKGARMEFSGGVGEGLAATIILPVDEEAQP